jgi:hypothetical protein
VNIFGDRSERKVRLKPQLRRVHWSNFQLLIPLHFVSKTGPVV